MFAVLDRTLVRSKFLVQNVKITAHSLVILPTIFPFGTVDKMLCNMLQFVTDIFWSMV